MSWLRQIVTDRWSLALLLGGVMAHLLMAFSFHLSPDETHYALYAVNPGWSYFDHPPLAGWLQWPWAQLGGQDVLMRVVPMLCWALAGLGVAAVTAELSGSNPADSGFTSPAGAASGSPNIVTARAALLLWMVSPIPHLLGLALVPDTLLLPITCAIMGLTWRLCSDAQARNWPLWLWLGFFLGLAGLSKYTAVLIALGAVLTLLLAHGPRFLAQPQPWVAALVAAFLISPVILWNASHDWISLAYQFGHAKGVAEWRAIRMAGFVLVQLFGYGLLLLMGWLAALRLSPRKARADVSAGRRISVPLFCACFGLPTLLLLTYFSGRGATLPHWSATAWAALVPAAAIGCQLLWQRWRKWLIGLGVFQAFCCVGLVALMLLGGVSSETGEQATSAPGQAVAGARFNPMADLYGWDDAARRARLLAQENGTVAGQPTLAVFNWTLASRIAWYARPLPVKVVQRHLDQFGLWWGTLTRGESVLLVDWSQMSFVPPVGADQFEQCRLLEQRPVMRAGRQIAHFSFLLCQNWQGPVGLPLDGRR